MSQGMDMTLFFPDGEDEQDGEMPPTDAYQNQITKRNSYNFHLALPKNMTLISLDAFNTKIVKHARLFTINSL